MHSINAALFCMTLTACSAKPFQPPPPTFKQFSKPNSTIEDVIQGMASCGYLDMQTGRNPGDKAVDIIARQNCMLKKGFSYLDGRGSLCMESAFKNLTECKDF